MTHLEPIYFFGHSNVACEILVPRPGIKPGPLTVKARSPNHWTNRESLRTFIS